MERSRDMNFEVRLWSCRGGATGSEWSRKNPAAGLSPFGTLSWAGHPAIACNLCLDRHRWFSLLCLVRRSSLRSWRPDADIRVATSSSKRGFSSSTASHGEVIPCGFRNKGDAIGGTKFKQAHCSFESKLQHVLLWCARSGYTGLLNAQTRCDGKPLLLCGFRRMAVVQSVRVPNLILLIFSLRSLGNLNESLLKCIVEVVC